MLDILSVIPGKKRHTPSGWWSFNAVCCHHRGHKPDRRSRAGIIFSDQQTWSYSCFNCQFKCGISPGRTYSTSTKKLLQWCGQDANTIERWSFDNFRLGNPLQRLQIVDQPVEIRFQSRAMPDGAVRLDPDNAAHSSAVEYLRGRGLQPDSYQYWVTPGAQGRLASRIIMPYYYGGQIVGNTSRFYDGASPKYIKDSQRGFVFNVDAQPKGAEACILVEGEFDAISIGGCAYMGSNISDEQAILLSRLYRRIIVVPDRDQAGMNVCNRALELGYSVSIPDWADDIKDVNDAVRRYGRLSTLLSILQNATSSAITVGIKRKKFK